jgi:hypothetical protein
VIFKRKYFKPGLYDISDESELINWVMLDIENPDLGSAVIRLRTSKPILPDIKKYKICVEIKWDYSLQSAGMPDENVSNSYKNFENLVDELFWYNNLSFNVKIITGFGERVWVIYTKSYNEFIDILNKKLDGAPTYPLKISYYEDPNWEVWRDGVNEHIKDKT